MKLKQLLENIKTLRSNEIEYLKNNCSEFIKESRGLPLFRGVSIEFDNFIIKNITKRSSLMKFVDYFNYFNDKLKESGFKAIRNNSALCTGNLNVALHYGTLYRIFPVNNYSYTWNPYVKDYVSDYYKTVNPVSRDLKEEDAIKMWNKFGQYYKDTDLVAAINSGKEILLNAEKYIGIRISTIGNDNIQYIVDDILKSVS